MQMARPRDRRAGIMEKTYPEADFHVIGKDNYLDFLL